MFDFNFQYDLLKNKFDNFSQILEVEQERADALLSSVGELQGMIDEQSDALGTMSNSFDYLENIDFSREKFFGSLSALKSMADNIFYLVNDKESLVKELTGSLETFFSKYKFLEMFDDTNKLFVELEDLKNKVNFQLKNFNRNDFEKLHFNFISLIARIEQEQFKVDNVQKNFNELFKENVNITKEFNGLVTNNELLENKKKLLFDLHSLISNYDLLLNRLELIKDLEEPNFLFIGQSLNNYIAKMLEKGFREDYIVDNLFYYGVSKDMSKYVISRLVGEGK